ncbi:MAG: thermitase, partial [Gaiellaceae bacterium]|nr:thermitase [Gaiellaceae bacterium]
MGRRLLVVAALAFCCSGVAAAATADPLEPQEYWLARVGADRATPPGPGVPIAIIDSGTDPQQPEFQGRANTTFLNEQTISGAEEFHGTAVASVAAAPRNGLGIVGVYPEAVLQLFDASPVPGTINRLAAIVAIRNVAEHCPAVINLSFSSVIADPSLYSAILTAVHNGCLVIAAAGNTGLSGNPTIYPAAYPHVLTVGATDQNDAPAPFSTLGSTL